MNLLNNERTLVTRQGNYSKRMKENFTFTR